MIQYPKTERHKGTEEAYTKGRPDSGGVHPDPMPVCRVRSKKKSPCQLDSHWVKGRTPNMIWRREMTMPVSRERYSRLLPKQRFSSKHRMLFMVTYPFLCAWQEH